jgi:hypothetical protein
MCAEASLQGELRVGETRNIAFASTAKSVLIAKLHGGDSITMKQTATSSQVIYLGFHQSVDSTSGYKMENGEVVSLSLDSNFGRDAFIEIWALSDSTSNTLSYIKLSGASPSTEAT